MNIPDMLKYRVGEAAVFEGRAVFCEREDWEEVFALPLLKVVPLERIGGEDQLDMLLNGLSRDDCLRLNGVGQFIETCVIDSQGLSGVVVRARSGWVRDGRSHKDSGLVESIKTSASVREFARDWVLQTNTLIDSLRFVARSQIQQAPPIQDTSSALLALEELYHMDLLSQSEYHARRCLLQAMSLKDAPGAASSATLLE